MRSDTLKIQYVLETNAESILAEHEMDYIAKILAEWIYNYTKERYQSITLKEEKITNG